MLTNTLNVALGFTQTSRSLAVVEREARQLARARREPVRIWQDSDGYTGFVVEGTVAEEREQVMGRSARAVRIIRVRA